MKFTKLTKKWVAERLPKRPKDANKGTFGKVLVVAGSKNFPGAAYLCCAACYRVGAGLVTLVTEPQVKIIVSRKLPELTFLPFNEAINKIYKYDVLLVGPGLRQDYRLPVSKLPATVIDAGGLEWGIKLKGDVAITPHPGEMTRLTGVSVEEIQADRINVAQYYAKKWKKVIVLKGANTVVAAPFGQVMISPFANPVLSTAGTGDILSGVIAGMSAQGLELFDAACVGVYIHGLAGELIGKKIGTTGMLAGDLLPFLPQAIKQLI